MVRLLLWLSMLAAGLAVGLPGGPAQAAVSRVRWRGVETQGGAPPPRLEAATAAHLALALRSLGASLVPGVPFDAEALARCNFAVAKRAQCQVEVIAGELHAQRRAEVPFRDADDLAESIALLVSGMLQTDFADLAQQIELEPERVARDKPPRPAEPPPRLVLPPEPPPKLVLPPEPGLAPRSPPGSRVPRATLTRKAPDRGNLLFAVGPSVAVGFSGDPPLFGASVRAYYLSRRVLRVGGSLGLEGADVSRSGFRLSFFRMLAAPRLGVGLTRGSFDANLTAGPALHILYGSTAGASHTLVSAALALGARLGLRLGDGWWVEAGVDVVGSLQDEKVAQGPAPVTQFGHWWLDVALALVYRR